MNSVPLGYAIVGAQKAATSFLAGVISRHPEVARSPRKEWHLFDDERRDWRTEPVTAEQCRVRSRRPGERISGDATPSYLFWPGAVERLVTAVPEVRLIAVLRDPVERAVSQWMMLVNRAGVTPDFDAFAEECWGLERPDRGPDGEAGVELRTRSILLRGDYSEQLRSGWEVSDPSAWLLFTFEEVTRDQETTAARCAAHLGLGTTPVDTVRPRHMTSTTRAMTGPSATMLRRMADRYAPGLAELDAVAGVDVAGWSTSRLLAGDLDAEEWAERLATKTSPRPGGDADASRTGG